MRWSTTKRQAAIYLSFGYTIGKTAKLLGIHAAELEEWTKIGEFAATVDAMNEKHVVMMSELLEDAERKAVLTAMEAMDAVDVIVDERGVEHAVPNWKVRQAAADSLLDRAGKRGKAVQKTEAKQLTGDITQALGRALAEPALKQILGVSMSAVETVADWEYAPAEPKQAEGSNEDGSRGTVAESAGSGEQPVQA